VRQNEKKEGKKNEGNFHHSRQTFLSPPPGSSAASPSGTYQDFVRRVRDEKTAAETSKTTCDQTAATAYTTGESALEPANTARKAAHLATYEALVTAKDTENREFAAADLKNW